MSLVESARQYQLAVEHRRVVFEEVWIGDLTPLDEAEADLKHYYDGLEHEYLEAQAER